MREWQKLHTDELLVEYNRCLIAADVSRSHVLDIFHELQHREAVSPEAYAIYRQLLSPDELLDTATGTKLTPSWQGRECLGNGEWLAYECCCDECDFCQVCFPQTA